MRTQYFTATGPDGFISTEDDSLEWLFPPGDPHGSSYPEFIADACALAMGSATSVWMVCNTGKIFGWTGSSWPYTQPAWIFSRRMLPSIKGEDIRFAKVDVGMAEFCHEVCRGGADGTA